MAISITEDIRDLLYENQLVIVNGLGMIKASYQSAQINEKSQTIAPPSLKYSFDNRIKETDGLLEKFIEKKYDLTEEQSQKVIKRFSDQVFSLLEQHKKIVIQGVGKLQRQGDSIVLKAYEGTEDPVSFGLPTLSLKKSVEGALNMPMSPPSLHNSHQEKSTTTESNTSKDKQPAEDQNTRKERVEPAGSGSEKNRDRKKKSMLPWILVLLLVLSFLVVLFSGLYLLNDDVSGFVHKLLNQEQKENIMDREVERQSDSAIKSLDDENPLEKTEKSEEQIEPVATNADCVIIVGLFGDQKNVSRITGIIESEGFEVYRRSLSSGEQLGLYTSCSNYNDALNFAQSEIAQDAFLKNLSQ